MASFNVRLVEATGYSRQPALTEEEKTAYPFALDANLRPPSFMEITFVMLHGGSEVLHLRGDSIDTLERFSGHNGLPTHPRLRWLKISDKDGNVLRSVDHQRQWCDGDQRVDRQP